MFKDLKHLILEILKGKRNWTGPVDKKRAAHHAERLHHECTKNMFQNFHEVRRTASYAIFMSEDDGIDPRRTVLWIGSSRRLPMK